MNADVHIHMLLDGRDFRAAIAMHKHKPCDALIRSRLEDYRARGVRFLRDGGDRWDVSLRAKALAHEYGIDYRSPAFPICVRGHYGAFIGRSCADEREYLQLLRQVRAKGGDFVKLMLSGLIDFSQADTLTEQGPPPDVIGRMIALAHAEGFAVMAHANGERSVNAALDVGIESIEHGAFLSEATLLRLAQSDTVWVPTLSTIGNLIGSGRYPDAPLRKLLRSQQEKLAFFAAHGGRVGSGSDAGAFCVLHGEAAQQEYDYLQAALGSQTEAVVSAATQSLKACMIRRNL